MPIGILVIRWDNEIGPINEGFYPENLKITNNLLSQVYSSHRHQSLRPGFASVSLRKIKVVSFFSGIGSDYIGVENYIIALLLRRDEQPSEFKEILKKISAEILDKIQDRKFKKVLPNLYKNLVKIERSLTAGKIEPTGGHFISKGQKTRVQLTRELSQDEIKDLNVWWFSEPEKTSNFKSEKIIATSEIKIDKKIYEINQKDLIDYVNTFDKVSIEKIAEHFFPAPLSYTNYFISRRQTSMGFTTEKFAKTAQIVESAIETIKGNLKKLIQQNILEGKIKPSLHGFGSYFINEFKIREKRKREELKENKEKGIIKDKLIKIEELFQKEKFSVVNRKIDDIIKDAKRHHFDQLVNKAEDLRKDFINKRLLNIEFKFLDENVSNVTNEMNELNVIIKEIKMRHFDELLKMPGEILKKLNFFKFHNIIEHFIPHSNFDDDIKQLAREKLDKVKEAEFKTKYEELENLINKYDLAKIFQLNNITDASTFLSERSRLGSSLYQLYNKFGKNEEFNKNIISLAIKFYSQYVDFNPFDVNIQYFAPIYNSTKKSSLDGLKSNWRENTELQDIHRKIDMIDNKALINQKLKQVAEETRELTYDVPRENLYNFLLDFSQLIPDPQISKIQGVDENEYTLKSQMGDLYFKILEKEEYTKLIFQYDFLTSTWGEKGKLYLTFDEPSPGSVTLKVKNEIQEISKNNLENMNILNILGTYLKTYLDFNLGKIVAKQVQIIFYEKTFDDLTMGNYRILQAKLNVLGKDIDKLKVKYFEVKAPLTLTSFNCSECGATLNITSKKDKFIICEHCNTPFLMEWQK